MESLEKIDEYLAGKLSEIDKKSFEKEIENDKNLENEVSKQLLAKEAIKMANLRINVKAVQDQFLLDNYSENERPKISRNWKLIGARLAASIAIFAMLFGGLQWINLSSEKILSEDGLHYQEPTMRGENTDKNTITEAYKNGNYQRVISIFDSQKMADQKDQFLTAMAYFNLKDYNSSIKFIEEININFESNQLYINELQYYKGLNLIGLNRYEEAISLFEKIKADPNNVYQKNITTGFLLKLKALSIKN